MSLLHRTLLLTLAAASLAVLGWDAFRPRPVGPGSVPATAPGRASTPPREAGADTVPHFTHLAADRLLRPGQRLTVHGGIGGLTPTNPVTLSLEGPDGTMASAELQDSGIREAVFTLPHPTPALTPGTFTWKLRLRPSDDPIVLGVQVVDADPPRLLLLLDHPSVEGARLQRWLSQSGSPVATRTRVSAERNRVSSSDGAAVALERLDAPALASFDGVVAHAAAIDRLSPEEHAALETAIRREGLGLLILASDEPRPAALDEAHPTPRPTSLPGPVAPVRSPLVTPWLRPSPRSADAPAGPRETRVHLANGIRLESPVTVHDAELVIPPAGQTLAEDPQGRALVAAASLGRGRWAYSIVLDAWRWRQRGREDDYAHFWSTLLSAIARPLPASSGSWSMTDASIPAFVDEPLTVVWSGAPDAPLPAAEVQPREVADGPAFPLGLTRSPSEPSHARARFWPAHPGWHTVRALPSGPALDIYVQPAGALPGIRRQRESDHARRSTGEAVTPRAVDPTPPQSAGPRPWIRLAAFLLFVASAGSLWHEAAASRLGQRRSPNPAAA